MPIFEAALEARFARIKGVGMRYFAGGEGPPLVLLHGFGGAASNWAEVIPRLAREHRLIVPDLPGHAGSSPLPAAATMAAYAERVARVVDREDAWPALVAGHSMGALVALRLALRRPESVSGLVLAGAAGISSRSRHRHVLVTLDAAVRPGRLPARFARAIVRVPWLRWPVFGGWGAVDPPSLSERAVAGLLSGPPLHTDLPGAAAALARDDIVDDLGRIQCPVLLVWGARDRQTPIRDGFEYARLLGAELRAIPACGHLLIGERPDACASAIQELHARVAARPAL